MVLSTMYRWIGWRVVVRLAASGCVQLWAVATKVVPGKLGTI
jgi:hypothetical protein